ncbi:hypothetical protein HAX54_038298, partial [Datura stramonium]|nr:hypothetical protein [Datura stramonium]
ILARRRLSSLRPRVAGRFSTRPHPHQATFIGGSPINTRCSTPHGGIRMSAAMTHRLFPQLSVYVMGSTRPSALLSPYPCVIRRFDTARPYAIQGCTQIGASPIPHGGHNLRANSSR